MTVICQYCKGRFYLVSELLDHMKVKHKREYRKMVKKGMINEQTK